MNPTLKDYQDYLDEYDKQYAIIEQLGGEEGIAFDIGPKLNKAAFSQAFKIAEMENTNESSMVIAHKVARTQLFYASPSQAEKQLTIWDNLDAVKLMPESIRALENNITKEDLIYGTAKGRQLIAFIQSEYERFIREDKGAKKGKASRAAKRISQLYFGS